MKKSIMRATLPRNPPLLQLLDPIKKAGFDGIQLGILETVGELTLRSKDADVEALRRAFKDAGLEPHSIYGGIRFFHAEAADRQRALEDGKRVVEIAAGLGAKTWLIHPGQLSPELPYDVCWRYTLDSLNALKEKAEATHLRIGLENVWNKFLMSPLEFVRLLEEVNSPQIGIWFDIGNVVPFGYPEQWLRILGPKHLVGIHIKDFKRGPSDIFGTYDGFVPVFHGSVNWPIVMRQLAAGNFNDYLVTEVALGRQPLPAALQEVSRQLDVLISQGSGIRD
jgi:L-ribulose-5-phosphate 3-epimerase